MFFISETFFTDFEFLLVTLKIIIIIQFVTKRHYKAYTLLCVLEIDISFFYITLSIDMVLVWQKKTIFNG